MLMKWSEGEKKSNCLIPKSKQAAYSTIEWLSDPSSMCEHLAKDSGTPTRSLRWNR